MGGRGQNLLFRDNFSCPLDPTCSEIVLSKFTELSHLSFVHLPSREVAGVGWGCRLGVKEKSRAFEQSFELLTPSGAAPRAWRTPISGPPTTSSL